MSYFFIFYCVFSYIFMSGFIYAAEEDNNIDLYGRAVLAFLVAPVSIIFFIGMCMYVSISRD